MRICALPILTAVAIAMIGAGAAHAQSGPTCGAFSLVGTDKKFSVVDNAPVGKSLGDVRVGSRVLVGKDGKRAGEVHFVATLTGISPRDVLASKYFVMFADGWIAADFGLCAARCGRHQPEGRRRRAAGDRRHRRLRQCPWHRSPSRPASSRPTCLICPASSAVHRDRRQPDGLRRHTVRFTQAAFPDSLLTNRIVSESTSVPRRRLVSP